MFEACPLEPNANSSTRQVENLENHRLDDFLLSDVNFLELWVVFKAHRLRLGDLYEIVTRTVEPALSGNNPESINTILTPCGRELLRKWVREAPIYRSRARKEHSRLTLLHYNRKKADEIYCAVIELRKDVLKMEPESVIHKWFPRETKLYLWITSVQREVEQKKTHVAKLQGIVSALNLLAENVESLSTVLNDPFVDAFKKCIKDYLPQFQSRLDQANERVKYLQKQMYRRWRLVQRVLKQFPLYEKAIVLLKEHYEKQKTQEV